MVDIVEADGRRWSADDVCGLVAGFGILVQNVLLMVKYTVSMEVNRLVANETGETLVVSLQMTSSMPTVSNHYQGSLLR